MRHRVAGRRLSRPTAHRWALYRNLVTDLIKYDKIVTTEAKAKEIRGLAEKMITLGKEGSLASRRRALSFVTDKKLVDKIFSELAPRYMERPGGYTRIVKLGRRVGDGARLAQVEMVE
ncbi:MAG: 50S ribosomal protein L17 [Chloroflexi bacterium]|nr:50S ribosomal protein L17 [Chloroflexota bacterium]MBL7061726.1 50S ribosomal protein L17 [Dehalococcoidia bacterium]